jgi:hypothetical protein
VAAVARRDVTVAESGMVAFQLFWGSHGSGRQSAANLAELSSGSCT